MCFHHYNLDVFSYYSRQENDSFPSKTFVQLPDYNLMDNKIAVFELIFKFTTSGFSKITRDVLIKSP